MIPLSSGITLPDADYGKITSSDQKKAMDAIEAKLREDVKVIDPYDLAFPYDLAADRLTYEEAVEASGDKLGMDYLSMGMVYNATTEDEYNEWWMAYIERWNELMPDIPLYSNYYYDVYNANIENFVTSPFFGPARAILYSNIKGY